MVTRALAMHDLDGRRRADLARRKYADRPRPSHLGEPLDQARTSQNPAKVRHGMRGQLTSNTADPIAHRSPITAPVTSSRRSRGSHRTIRRHVSASSDAHQAASSRA